jgi:imidazolonepropionase-like amidohydrolase
MRPLLKGLLALGLAGATPVAAQTIAISHADVLTMGPAGEIKSGVVLIRGGRITAVGADLPIPAGAQVIDAGGKIVTPGLVSTHTPIGVVEVEGVEPTDDQATSSDKLSAAFDVQYAINPQSLVIPIARLGGITDAVATPSLPFDRGHSRKDMVFAGQAAVFALAGDDPVERPKAGMVLAMGEQGAGEAGGGRGAEFVLLRAIFDDVRDYAKNRAAYDRNQSRSYDLSREDLEALIPVVEGREPLVVSVHRAADILQVLKLAKEQHLKLVLEGAEEGWRVAPQIAAAGVPVMIYGAADLPSSFETLGSTLENAARLNTAGVMIALETPPLFTGGRTPRYDAGRAVAHGLPYSAALAAITLNPAKMWGVADRIGSLEVGKDADLVVWDGDPLETTSAPTAILIKGVAQSLRSRDLDLRDRYLGQDTATPAGR